MTYGQRPPAKAATIVVRESDVRTLRAWLRERVIESDDNEPVKEMLFDLYQKLGQ